MKDTVRQIVARLFSASVICLVLTGCTRSRDIAVCHLGSTWDVGEIKSCMQGKLKGDDSPVLLCGDDATAAFFMTAGALDLAKDDETRSRVRTVFYGRTKTFAISFHGNPLAGKDGIPLGMWQCRKTGAGIDCSI
jgi:hypothetical protein